MKQTKKEILKKYDLFGDPERIWADDAEKAMQEYADLFYKEKLRVDVPSEEEIKEESLCGHINLHDHSWMNWYNDDEQGIFITGATWMRDEILKRNKTE